VAESVYYGILGKFITIVFRLTKKYESRVTSPNYLNSASSFSQLIMPLTSSDDAPWLFEHRHKETLLAVGI
jgi:hypothetical protein